MEYMHYYNFHVSIYKEDTEIAVKYMYFMCY